MEKYVYIKKNVLREFIDFKEPLKAEEYNNLGSTWEDYEDNKWVLLDYNQILFYQENPSASPKEVWNMSLDDEPERTLDDAKKEKIREIIDYDSSTAVNSFSISGNTMWLSVTERQQLATQISANESIGRTEMTRWFNGIPFTFTIDVWKQMLVALEVYAGDAFNVTEYHKASVNALETIDDVDAYDYYADYPDKLEF